MYCYSFQTNVLFLISLQLLFLVISERARLLNFEKEKIWNKIDCRRSERSKHTKKASLLNEKKCLL